MYQEEVKSAIILLYLGILAGMDVRKRQISLVLTGVLFLAGIGWQILVEQTSWLEWLLSLLPGAGFLTLSYISREQVGYGDGLLLLTVGIWLGFGQTFGVLRSSSDAEENTETGFYTAGAVSAAWICGEVRNALKVKMRKASITVEAVLVVPLVLMVIFLLLSLTFFVHARSWYTFAAYESTMLAASEGRLSVEKGEAAAQSRMEWWISQIPLPAESVTVQTECREKEIQIKAEGNILPIWSRNAWEYSVLSESRRNNPVKTIRKIRAVKQIWNQK